MHAYAHTLGQEILKEREREREHVKHNKKEKKGAGDNQQISMQEITNNYVNSDMVQLVT